MNRINQLFQAKKENILSVYFPAGFPKLNDTLPILRALQAKGVNMVEVGIPFSDPMADGVVIQQASGVALRNGISLRLLFEQLEQMRNDVTIPVVLMGYLNPIMQFGFENFCKRCVETGVDGVIIPDLPFADYIKTYKSIADQYNVKVVMLVTPETSEERVRMIDQNTDSFIYLVSSASTTGAQSHFDNSKQAYFEHINGLGLKNPRLIGFGISNRSTLEAATNHSSGAIVGSKFVQLLGEKETISEAVDALLDALHQ